MLKIRNYLSRLGYPVAGVSQTATGYRIDLDETATEDQQVKAQEIADNWVEPPDPDWTGFRLALYAEDAWKRVLNSNPAVGATIASSLWQFQSDPTLATEIKFLWDSLIPGLDPAISAAEIEALNQIATDNHVPMAVGSDGFLSFSG